MQYLPFLSVECYTVHGPVCMCVRHTFCPLAYRSDPSMDFYSWYLKRCWFTQRCSFWGSRWLIITFSVQSPLKFPFWGPEEAFQAKYAQNSNSSISSDLCIRLTGSCSQQQRLCGWSRMVVKQFQDGGWLPFWKSIYRHTISVKNNPISMKFCTQQQILNWMNVTWSKMKKLHWTDSEFDRTYFLFPQMSRFLFLCASAIL